MIRVIAVIRVKCLEVTLVSWLGHCGRERVRGFYCMNMTVVLEGRLRDEVPFITLIY